MHSRCMAKSHVVQLQFWGVTLGFAVAVQAGEIECSQQLCSTVSHRRKPNHALLGPKPCYESWLLLFGPSEWHHATHNAVQVRQQAAEEGAQAKVRKETPASPANSPTQRQPSSPLKSFFSLGSPKRSGSGADSGDDKVSASALLPACHQAAEVQICCLVMTSSLLVL